MYKVEKIYIYNNASYDLGYLTFDQLQKQLKGFKLFQQLDNLLIYSRKNCKYFYYVEIMADV